MKRRTGQSLAKWLGTPVPSLTSMCSLTQKLSKLILLGFEEASSCRHE